MSHRKMLIARPLICRVRVAIHLFEERAILTIVPVPVVPVPKKIKRPVFALKNAPLDSLATVVMSATSLRSKALNKKNEEQDIVLLVNQINQSTDTELHRQYREAFPDSELLGARLFHPDQKKKAGSRSVHYDFQVQVRTPEGVKWLNVEHKGSSLYKPIDGLLPPWTGGVQFFNGGMEKYRICWLYAKKWYERYIGSYYLSTTYSITEPIPTCEEWIQRDARVQGDPKTAFGIALKKAVRAGGQESLRALRDEFVPDFVQGLTEDDRKGFIEDVTPIIRESLAQKDVWLQIAGDVGTGHFNSRWSPALSVGEITGVQWENKKDVVGFIQSDCAYPIRFILRWGKGAGFSNLRLDLK